MGSEARGGSRSAANGRGGGWLRVWAERDPALVVRLRGRNVSAVSTRPVTGLVGRGGGGPPRLREGRSSAAPPAPRSDLPGEVRSASYALLIWAIRRVAAREDAGSEPMTSGWFSRARRRQAALIVAWLAPRSTPRTWCGSRLGMVLKSTGRPAAVDAAGSRLTRADR